MRPLAADAPQRLAPRHLCDQVGNLLPTVSRGVGNTLCKLGKEDRWSDRSMLVEKRRESHWMRC
ncbi:MAG: hypothetical protein RMK97_06980 [Sutterellaceae bacterium]|nr:hypothetical protein [Burkholderiaceae bacterium]MDW8430231.1 hypothetical protein [Sutterellaceae bacterium]